MLCFLGKTIFPRGQVLHIRNVYVLKPGKCNTSPSSMYDQDKNKLKKSNEMATFM